jgi:NCS2 family nucleobase:cation symporter-2
LFVIALAFFTDLPQFFQLMPPPVMGAVLVYVACFMIGGRPAVITSRMLDVRRAFVAGRALIFGLSVEMVHGLSRQVPELVFLLFSSALSRATALAIALSPLFRLPVAKCRTARLVPDDTGNFDEITSAAGEPRLSFSL